jgi:glutathione S-transferase
MLRHVRMVDPELLPQGRYRTIEALSARCEARPEFQATFVPEAVYLSD